MLPTSLNKIILTYLYKSNKSWEIYMTEENKCGCGRSPTGKCIGWHALSEEDYSKRKEAYEAKQAQKK